MGEVEAKKDRVTRHDLRQDEEKEKALKTGYITLYTKFFTVTGPVILSTEYVTIICLVIAIIATRRWDKNEN
jgi:hypothetical protein